MARIVGIDLGTTNSVVAVVQGGSPVVIPTAEGGNLCPSIVGFAKGGEILVGQIATRQPIINPENTVYSIKRFMGRRYDEVEAERQMVPYQVVPGPGGDARVTIPQTGKTYTPQEISALILQKLKRDAEASLGEPVTQPVITVPAYFNDSQRQATKDAGQIAGLDVARIINEPTAAALAYGLDKKTNETILVWDLGGGTFDVSILEVGEGVVEVRATNGDTHRGSDNWDQRVVQWITEEFKKDQGIDLSRDRSALQRLREAAEKAKIELSNVMETENLPFITADASGPKHLQLKLTRARVDQLTEDLLQRCVSPFEKALADAKLKPQDLHEVILVGGATRMPMVQELVHRLTGGKEPHKGVNPDEVVAVGAAIQGAVLGGQMKYVLLLDVTPLSLGVETIEGAYGHYATADDLQDLFGDESPFSDFFTTIFGQARGAERAPRPRRGRDREVEVEVTLEEAYRGTTRSIQIGDRRIEAKIPSGVYTGARVRLAGQGEQGRQGGRMVICISSFAWRPMRHSSATATICSLRWQWTSTHRLWVMRCVCPRWSSSSSSRANGK